MVTHSGANCRFMQIFSTVKISSSTGVFVNLNAKWSTVRHMILKLAEMKAKHISVSGLLRVCVLIVVDKLACLLFCIAIVMMMCTSCYFIVDSNVHQRTRALWDILTVPLLIVPFDVQ